MKCKKHGEVGGGYITFKITVQPVICNAVGKGGKEIELATQTISKSFCTECLMNFLEKKIGVVK